jgi:uncharacterized cupin superfamily protein
MKPAYPKAIKATEAPPRARPSGYPEPLASRVKGREKRPLGDVFGLQNFGVSLTRLAQGAESALRHAHAKQDEFVYILEGRPRIARGVKFYTWRSATACPATAPPIRTTTCRQY